MFLTIKRLYEKTGDAGLVEKALARGWITEEGCKEITGGGVTA